MKQIAQNYRSGDLQVLDVPPPVCSPGGVLVRSLYSLISTGTEMMKVSESKMSLIGKARARPEQVKKVLDTAVQEGPLSAYKKAMNRLDAYTPLGYSLAGIVVESGRGAEELAVGQLVACAGNEFAFHAELNWVPVNLCVPVPMGVAPQAAAFSTVGAIALQGVRQADAQLGDTACVIGLGLVGQLVVRLLVAAGVRTVGIDVVPERCRLAEKAGALLCAAPDEAGIRSIESSLADASGGLGADRVFLVAGGQSNEPVELAARVARDRATVVDIGKCGLDLPWNAYYDKELDLRFSRSYGPGRYDPRYEVDGVDYPAGYVRWTERRNLACFVDLLAKGDIDLGPLVSGIFPVSDAVQVYERLKAGDLHGIGFLFEYPEAPAHEDGPEASGKPPRAMPALPAKVIKPPRRSSSQTRVGFIGAGNYASSMLLPRLAQLDTVSLEHVATRRSLSAMNAKRKFGFQSASADTEAVLCDESLDAVFIVTRHSSHAALVCRALQAGKAVFVEKPLAISNRELDRIIETADSTGNHRLMVGFNRRFAPLLSEMRARFGRPEDTVAARYLVNAGPLAKDSWYRNEDAEGSRFVGEGGHFIDTLSWWMGAEPIEVTGLAAADLSDMHVVLRYPSGALGTVTYVTGGHPRFPKETFEASGGGRTARLENFRRGTVWVGRRRHSRRVIGAPDKGQRNEIEAFIRAVRNDDPMPIPFASLVATTRATLAAASSVATGRPERL